MSYIYSSSSGAVLPDHLPAALDRDGGGGGRLLPHLTQEPGEQAHYCRYTTFPPSPLEVSSSVLRVRNCESEI